MNKVEMIGRLTRDPELAYTQSGSAYCRFGIAVRRRFKNKDGEYEADFFNLIAWGKTGEFIAEYFRKGREIAVVGSLQSRSWEADDGSRRTAVEINVDEVEFVGSKGDNSNYNDGGAEGLGEEVVFDDNDLPF